MPESGKQDPKTSFTNKWLMLPGESFLASLGIVLALSLLCTTLVSIYSVLRSETNETLIAQQRQTKIVGQLLANNIESLLEQDDLFAVRRLVIQVAHDHSLATCRVSTLDSKTIADIDPKQHEIDSIDLLSSDSTPAEPVEVDEADTNDNRYTLYKRGLPAAYLVVEAATPDAQPASWRLPLIMGATGLINLAVLYVFYIRSRKRLRASAMVHEALACLRYADTADTALKLSTDLGEEAVAWNGLLDHLRELREQVVERRVDTALRSVEHSTTDLSAVCDEMPDGLLLLDAELQVIYANGAAQVFLGRQREEIAGLELADLFDDKAVVEATERAGKQRGSARGIVELDRREEGDGGVFRIVARSVRRSDSASSMLIIQDITQQRLAQEAHSAFLTQAAHELRTPLTNIRLHTEMAIDHGDSDPTMRAESLNAINTESIRLERVVSDMLSVAEIEAGALRLCNDDVHLERVMKQIEADHGPQAAAKQIALAFHLPPKIPTLHGDQDKIILAIQNLVGNAIKYTPEGGNVTVEVETRTQQLIVRVVDTGYGISEQDAVRVFDKFFRSDDERVRKLTGSGLGLPLAREVIRMHGGDITLESELDNGSTFVMTLQITEAAALS